MGDTAREVIGLSPEDQRALQRSRKHLKGMFVAGWLLILLAGFVIPAGLIARRYLIAELNAIATSVTGKLQEESGRLKSRQATTPLEKELLATLLEKNQQLRAFLNLQVVVAMAIVALFLVHSLLHSGMLLLSQAALHRRYLRVIDALEHMLRLSRG